MHHGVWESIKESMDEAARPGESVRSPAPTSAAGLTAREAHGNKGPVLQVLVNRARLSSAAEAELRVAVRSFATVADNILQRGTADEAGPATGPLSDCAEERNGCSTAKLTSWLEHFGSFQIDCTPAVSQQCDTAVRVDGLLPPSAAAVPNSCAADVATVDTVDAVVSKSVLHESELPPAKRARAVTSQAPANEAAHSSPSSSISGIGRESDGIDRQDVTPSSDGRRRSRTSIVRIGKGHSRYMGYGWSPSTIATDNSGAANGAAGTTVRTTTSSTSNGDPTPKPPPPSAFKPGQLSSALREALDMTGIEVGTRQDVPPYLERMRKLGWPPGWTSQRYNHTRQVWESVPSIAKTSFPGLNWPDIAEANEKHTA